MWLRQLAQAKGYSLQGLARRVGCDYGSIRRIDFGGNTSLRLIEEIARALGYPPEELVRARRLQSEVVDAPSAE